MNCHYSLANLTEHRCPECGREFDPNDPSTFAATTLRATWFGWAVLKWLTFAFILLMVLLMSTERWHVIAVGVIAAVAVLSSLVRGMRGVITRGN